MCHCLIMITPYACGCEVEEPPHLIESCGCGGCGIAVVTTTSKVTANQPCSACIESGIWTYATGTWKLNGRPRH
ncbi:hypothetical protein BGW36DRAFT_383910 [Talaromyces proteolyticus]|uniref:Uncharacterized protein n=1 Tax=Talaromyces proteolyticus TaxID=1131652 RepID=A0AAD4KJH6_9EURO|nr:uncharacterized protein BGW36DRAFT_383910 [Talaromyces proteolyticus]KAH8693885.1 hypothetical protein BGW36DRAFT_383910 [Talaromyces proteolyticus]